jgi:hypothetical protein
VDNGKNPSSTERNLGIDEHETDPTNGELIE